MDHHVAYSLGAAYAQLGRMAESRAWLDRSVATGFACYPWYVRDPLLEPLRRDPASHEFLEPAAGAVELREGALRLTPRQERPAAPRPEARAPCTVALRPCSATASPARTSVPRTGRASTARAPIAPTPP